MPWVRDPDRGGVKIPEPVRTRTSLRILAYAEKHYSGKFTRIDIRFRGQFCYIDAFREPNLPDNFPPSGFSETKEEYVERVRNSPVHLGRLRYFGNEEAWSYAFYKYSDEKYELCVLEGGDYYGTPEEAFEAGAVYLQD